MTISVNHWNSFDFKAQPKFRWKCVFIWLAQSRTWNGQKHGYITHLRFEFEFGFKSKIIDLNYDRLKGVNLFSTTIKVQKQQQQKHRVVFFIKCTSVFSTFNVAICCYWHTSFECVTLLGDPASHHSEIHHKTDRQLCAKRNVVIFDGIFSPVSLVFPFKNLDSFHIVKKWP